MADTGIIDLDSGVVSEKRGVAVLEAARTNLKAPTVQASSSTPAKHRRGHPVGGKNKVKASTMQDNTNEHLDISVAHPNPPQPYAGVLFSFSCLLVCNVYNSSVSLSNLLNSWMAESYAKLFCEVDVYYDGESDMFFRGGRLIRIKHIYNF
jgi:hypothetical protein